jgi:putative DNA modification/repair radical SAM protein
MSTTTIQEKLEILADAVKYDVSCASSGGKRKNENKGLGNSEGMGICHSYTEDGRCVSLLKILLTNFCIYDCAYCITRKSNDIKRTAFTVQEVVDLTINFYRRNYIEGLFLSSGIFKNADYTMERLVRVAKELRTNHNFHGYIHLKTIPGASSELLKEAGLYADRLSVNIELPSEVSLKQLAPEKNYAEIFTPMNYLKEEIISHTEEKRKFRSAPAFAGGQSTQLIVGASPEKDLSILSLANGLYKEQNLKRVYYSGYVPVSNDNRLPVVHTTPVIRENRLYQADWLLRFYGFSVEDIVNPVFPSLDLELDPKTSYALRNMHLFPIEINTADYEWILRVPGIGVKSANMIVSSRRFGAITFDHLIKMGIVLKRAKFFITCNGVKMEKKYLYESQIRQRVLSESGPARKALNNTQLPLFG